MHNMVYEIDQTPDGAIWFCTRGGLSRFDPSSGSWTSYTPGDAPNRPRTICVARDGSLWVGFGSSSKGVVRYDGKTWTRYGAEDGLGSDKVMKIVRGRNDDLWFGTYHGLTRFDGTTWLTYSRDELPASIGYHIRSIATSSDGALWLRGWSGSVMRLVQDQEAPETVFEPVVERVSSSGNLLLRWSGHYLWNDTPQSKLHYQWRLD